MNLKKVCAIIIILFIFLILCCFSIFKRNSIVQAVSLSSQTMELYINENPINIEKVLKDNTKNVITEEMNFDEIDIEYTTIYNENEDLPSGTIHVMQVGADGLQEIITIKQYENGELKNERIVASNIKKVAVDKVVEIGIGNGKNNYKLKNGDEVYSTATALSVMEEANFEAKKIVTIPSGTKVKVEKVYDNGWSYIFIDEDEKEGYVLTECLSNINPKMVGIIDGNYSEYSKEILLTTLSRNMDLSVPSKLSLEQFRKILQNSSDINKIFTENSDYFYYAEQEYGINGVFLAAIAIHESGWGTSNIALQKNNLFGYSAYDENSYLSAKVFDSYAEGIDLLARVLIKYYLNPNGAVIYGGNIAEGKYYSGKNVDAVNKKYASDSNWASKVYSIMQNLYNSL